MGYEDSFRLDKLEKFLGKKIERVQFTAEELSGKLPTWDRPLDKRPKVQAPVDAQKTNNKEVNAAPKEHRVRPVNERQNQNPAQRHEKSSTPNKQIANAGQKLAPCCTVEFFHEVVAKICLSLGALQNRNLKKSLCQRGSLLTVIKPHQGVPQMREIEMIKADRR